MTLSRDHWDPLRSRHIWSLQESADQMGRGLMGLQSCPGEAEESWSGMPRVLAPLPHPTVTWPPWERGPWLIRRKRKKAKYAELATTHHFVPLAIETTGVFGSEAQMFFWELGRRIRDEPGEPLAYQYLRTLRTYSTTLFINPRIQPMINE